MMQTPASSHRPLTMAGCFGLITCLFIPVFGLGPLVYTAAFSRHPGKVRLARALLVYAAALYAAALYAAVLWALPVLMQTR